MKSVSAYRAEDGSIHETREGAARADLVVLGFDSASAAKIIEHREEVTRIFQQVDGLSYIPVHYPDPAIASLIQAAE